MQYYELFALRIQQLCKEHGITVKRSETIDH